MGLTPEAVSCLVSRCFTTLGCERVWCAHYDGNMQSRRVMEKCGFRFHHSETDKPTPLGDRRTEHMFVITRNDYNNLHQEQ